MCECAKSELKRMKRMEYHNSKTYSPKEFYTAIFNGLRTVKYLRRSRKNHLIPKDFMERIMLAVTEVNGCEICSYFHTKVALESGMSREEIEALLSGRAQGVPEKEAVAVLFAQHYADTRGNPTKKSWDRFVEEYGEAVSFGVLGAIRMIMIGNISGIAYSALRHRIKGHPAKKSSLVYEVGMLLLTVAFVPVAGAHAMIFNAIKRPVLTFEGDD